MSLAKFTARSLLSTIFITGGLGEFKKADQLSGAVDGLLAKLPESARSKIPDVDPALLVKVNGASMLTGGSLLALGIKPRLAAAVLAAQLIPVTVAGHAFWDKEGAERQSDKIQVYKNLSLIGGLLAVALDGAK
ncbi:DoxX family protein [Cutibacterium sp. WCA-380-WT-3A]|uniref:DoxX family protein n=1 Tax=Cutibacterium porci TaxID=2605781 RepID=A0A7K0J6Z8_9ACTN|nr:DoxX family protein [Cutibacterium porci]MSS45724.1 DoxX family protein [Cutibacterium porci]